MSPSIENTPSTMTILLVSASRWRMYSRLSMSWCLYLATRPKLMRVPSMIEAWSVRSTMATSLRPTSEEMVPWLAKKPVEKIRASSLPTRAASFSSSSTWMSRVPLRNRDPAQPVPYLAMAALAASFTLRMVGQPQVVVAAQHDDLAAIVPDGVLLGRLDGPEEIVETGVHEVTGRTEAAALVEQAHSLRHWLGESLGGDGAVVDLRAPTA